MCVFGVRVYAHTYAHTYARTDVPAMTHALFTHTRVAHTHAHTHVPANPLTLTRIQPHIPEQSTHTYTRIAHTHAHNQITAKPTHTDTYNLNPKS